MADQFVSRHHSFLLRDIQNNGRVNGLITGIAGARVDELSSGALDYFFAYRAFDLRDRFPAPFPDFRSALEALQSETAYLPETSGEIVAYCRDGRSIEIPRPFFIRNEAGFESRAAAQQWVRDRQSDIEEGNRFSQLSGIAVANPDDPVDKQVADALAFRGQPLRLSMPWATTMN